MVKTPWKKEEGKEETGLLAKAKGKAKK